MMSELFFMCIGIFLGWVVIPQPDWAQKVYDWMVMEGVKLWVKYVKKEKVEDNKDA